MSSNTLTSNSTAKPQKELTPATTLSPATYNTTQKRAIFTFVMLSGAAILFKLLVKD